MVKLFILQGFSPRLTRRDSDLGPCLARRSIAVQTAPVSITDVPVSPTELRVQSYNAELEQQRIEHAAHERDLKVKFAHSSLVRDMVCTKHVLLVI